MFAYLLLGLYKRIGEMDKGPLRNIELFRSVTNWRKLLSQPTTRSCNAVVFDHLGLT